jgi:hypothetical protein
MDSGYSGSIFDSYKGFHAFCDLKSANNYKLRLAIKTFPYISVAVRNNEIVIKCLAKRSWVIDVGVDINTNTIRLTKLCFPKCPNKKVTVREFRNELKKETK